MKRIVCHVALLALALSLAACNEGPRNGDGPRKAPAAGGEAVAPKDLLDYGLVAELLGRLPVVVELDALSEADLVRILRQPPDSILREYEALMAADGIRLKWTEPALREFARHAAAWSAASSLIPATSMLAPVK